MIRRFAQANSLLVLLLLLALLLRFWGINFGLPYTYAADEDTRMNVALNILKTGDLNPHWLGYPHLAFYLNTIAYAVYFFLGRLSGIFATPADIPYPDVVTIGVGRLAMPSEFLVGRGLTALFATGAVLLVYLIGYRISNRKSVGLVAAALFAVSPAAVAHSKFISLDSFGLFFLLLAFLWIIPLLHDAGPREYALAGIGCGLAFSGKYNVGLVLFSLVLAHFLRFGTRGLKRKELYFAFLFAALSFAVCNPFSIADMVGFFFGLTMAAGSQSQYSGTGQSSFQWYIAYLIQFEGVAAILAGVQAVLILLRKSRSGLVLLSFPVVYFILVSLFAVHNDRTILPMVPFLDLMASLLLVGAADWIAKQKVLQPRIATVLLTAATAFVALHPLQVAVAADLTLTRIDGRETAREWIASLPSGTRIAVEGYSPFADRRKYAVQGVVSLVDKPAEWYVQNGFEYVVASQGMYGRFFAEPASYPDIVAKYQALFARFPEAARFDDNGYEIRILKTGAVLPEHETAARFGDYGNLIELVGYETSGAKWMVGSPLNVTLYWRPLGHSNEPLNVSLRLVDQDEQQVGQVQGDLFQGQFPASQVPEKVFATRWSLPVTPGVGPGLYHIAVNVIQARYNYQTPVMTWAAQKLNALQLGPIKMNAPTVPAAELKEAKHEHVQWGDEIALEGWKPTDETLQPGQSLPLTFYWRALSVPRQDYTLFIHLVDANGVVRAQSDSRPFAGRYPPSLWDAGEMIRDREILSLPQTLPAGNYRIEVGWYNLGDMARLPVVGTDETSWGDHWVLDIPFSIK